MKRLTPNTFRLYTSDTPPGHDLYPGKTGERVPRTQTGTWDRRVVTGPVSADAESLISSWTQDDYSGGFGIEDGNESTDTSRIAFGVIDGRHPKSMCLPPETVEVTSPTWAETGAFTPLGDIGTQFYGAWANGISGYNTATQAWHTTQNAWPASFVIANHPVPFCGFLYVPGGATGICRLNEATAATGTLTVSARLTTLTAVAMGLHDGNLWAIDTANKLWRLTPAGSAAGGVTLANWGPADDLASTTGANLKDAFGNDIILDTGLIPTRLFSWFNSGQEEVLWCVTQGQGAYLFNPDEGRWIKSRIKAGAHPDWGTAAEIFRDGEDLFISGGGLDVTRLTIANVEVPISGPSKDQGVPPDYQGTIIDLLSERSSLYALVQGGTSVVTGPPTLTWTLQQTVGNQGAGSGQFNTPDQVAIDASGNVFVADSANNRVQKFTAAGVHSANIGSLIGCRGVAVDSSGNIYASLTGGTIKKYSSALVLQWTSTAFGADFVHLATDGTVVWATTASHTIRVYACSDGTFITTYGASGSGNGQFNDPIGIAHDGANLYVVDRDNSRVQKLTPGYAYAAKVGASGSGNGQFAQARGMAVDSTGRVLVCDEDNERIQRFTNALVFDSVLVAGGAGSGDGQFASNNGPYDIAMNADDSFWVADKGNARIQKFTAAGAYSAQVGVLGTTWALQGTFGSTGTGNDNFDTPNQVAVDSSGNVYIADRENDRLIKRNSSGAYVSSISGLTGITGVAVDSSGNIYTSEDAGAGFATLYKYNSSFVEQWSIVGVAGSVRHFATDGTHVYYTRGTGFIVKRSCATGGLVATFGSAGTGNGQFNGPWGICLSASGTSLYIVDSGNNRVQRIGTSGTFIEKWGSAGTGSSQFNAPRGVQIGSDGHPYVCDYGNDRLQRFDDNASHAFVESISQANPDGIGIATGDVLWVSNADGDTLAEWDEQADALSAPTAIATNQSTGRIYVGDDGNDRIVFLDSDGSYLGQWGSFGSAAGQFAGIAGMAIHPTSDEVYVTDSSGRVQVFNADGAYQRVWIAGTTPTGITIQGHVFVTDNSDDVVREYTTAGDSIGTIGATGSGDGQLSFPIGIGFDSSGNLFVVDQGNNRVQKFTYGAYVTQWGTAGAGNDNYSLPLGVTLDASGDVWVCDSGNARLKRTGNTGTYQAQIAQSSPVGIGATSGDILWVSTGTHTLAEWDEETTETPSVESKAWLGGWSGTSWFALWESTADLVLTWMRLALTGDYALWWGDEDGVAYRQRLPPPFFNPAARVTLGVYPFAETGWMETFRYDANMSGWDKIASHFFTMMQHANASVYVDVSYRTDGDQFDSGLMDPPYRPWKRIDHIGRTLCRFDDTETDPTSGLPWREGEPFQWIQFYYAFRRDSNIYESPLWMWHSLHHISVPQDSASFVLKVPISAKPGKALGRSGDEMAETLRGLQVTRKMVHLQTRNPDPSHPEWQVFFRGRVTQVKSEFYLGADNNLDEVVVVSFVEIGESSNEHTAIATDISA